MQENSKTDTKTRLLESATRLFLEFGYNGTSTRAICKEAKTSLTSISLHFGNKEKLLQTILTEVNEEVFIPPIRVLKGGSNSVDEFSTKLKIFFQTSLTVLLEHSEAVTLACRETSKSTFFLDVAPYQNAIYSFLKDGQDKGIMDPNINIRMISGMFMDRILNQILYRENIKANFKVDIDDTKYQEEWLESSMQVFLGGLLKRH